MWPVTRQDIIKLIIELNNFERYLEIGIGHRNCFDQVICKYKVGCDPVAAPELTEQSRVHALTSNAFFKQNKDKFQIIFIDGLHLYEQLIQDIVNSWNVLELGGFIVCHDCMPMNAGMAGREPETPQSGWNGDCYKAIIWFRDTFPTIPCFVLVSDHGLGIIYKNQKEALPANFSNLLSYMDLNYDWLQTNTNRINFMEVEVAQALIRTLSKENKND